PDDSILIKALRKLNTGGFRCTYMINCRFVGPVLKRIRYYLKEVHKWDQKLKAGRRLVA
ncbi:hypothetical protein B0J13DRAFT_453860, partial [Dactylonectria estremocensis]